MEHVIALARRLNLRLMCRLVKGAYWDAEIKRAQELGLAHYPVYTHKHHTDTSYLPVPARCWPRAMRCTRNLPHTTQAPWQPCCNWQRKPVPAPTKPPRFELQRLRHGRALYREVLKTQSVRLRVYAPVANTATCWPIWCAACWKTAPTPPLYVRWPTPAIAQEPIATGC